MPKPSPSPLPLPPASAPRRGQRADRGPDCLVHARLGKPGKAKAFLQHADPQADDAGVQVGAVIAVWRAGPLARVEPVWPGQDAEHQGRVPHGPGDGAKVIEGYLDRERAAVRDQAAPPLLPSPPPPPRPDP